MTSREFFRRYFLKTLLVLIAIQMVIITIVQYSNHRPKALRDETSVIEGRTVKINPLENDTDKDIDNQLSIAFFNSVQHGKIEQDGRLLIYTPEKGFFGQDSILYTITDGKKTSQPAVVFIEVIENLPPTANPDSLKTYPGILTPVFVLSNDADKEQDSLFVSDFTQPKHGSLSLENNTFYYTSTDPKATEDHFEYEVNDGKSAKKTNVHIALKPKNDALYPWFVQDVGNTQFKGKVDRIGDRFSITGSGADIWYARDAFAFMYQYLEGDFEISTKVEKVQVIDGYTKSGIMVREDLGESSRHLFMALNAQLGSAVYQREKTNWQSQGFAKNDKILPPYWLKMKRQENHFTFFIAKDGRSWEEVYQTDFDLPNRVFVGLLSCSHNHNREATVEYSHVNLKP